MSRRSSTPAKSGQKSTGSAAQTNTKHISRSPEKSLVLGKRNVVATKDKRSASVAKSLKQSKSGQAKPSVNAKKRSSSTATVQKNVKKACTTTRKRDVKVAQKKSLAIKKAKLKELIKTPAAKS